jgi:uncharacterized membrane protein
LELLNPKRCCSQHSQHVVLVHFPIALFMTAAFFNLVVFSTKRLALPEAANYNFPAAAISTVPRLPRGSWHGNFSSPARS